MQVRTTERENTTVILSIITLTPVPVHHNPYTCTPLLGTSDVWFGGGG
jgi:hypothetical protein